MEELLIQIESAMKNNLYYIALQSSLTLPDICSSLINPIGKTSGQQYISWYDTYVKANEQERLSGKECYNFRCSMLHQGKSIHAKSNYSRIMFIEPSVQSMEINNCVIDDVLFIDLNLFCIRMISSVRNWMTLVEREPDFIKNNINLIKRHPNGLSPYIVGFPIIT